MPPATQSTCSHRTITYNPSPHATQVQFEQPTPKQRRVSQNPNPGSNLTLNPTQSRTDLDTFPAPLVLPGDDLALDPEYPPQDFQEWHDEGERNPVTARRRTIYVVSPPEVDPGIAYVGEWATSKPQENDRDLTDSIAVPRTQDVIDYLSAFYHGLPVKKLEIPNWMFAPWTEQEELPPSKRKGKGERIQKKPKDQYIALSTASECIRIRTRPSPDGIYTHQLNLDDLLDVAISVLPKDAYALCMLVNHDLFEDEDDAFVCGRAYGGSRVAVVSTARYNPLLDPVQDVERAHAWPAAHCLSYIQAICKDEGPLPKRKKASQLSTRSHTSVANNKPLEAALAAYSEPPPRSRSPDTENASTLWLWRIARTVSHELGHCFGLDHCVYYACIMQGSASLSEDARQPPYLCPVDLAKVLFATGSTVDARDRALLRYCERPGVRDGAGFRAYAAWLRASLGLGGVDSGEEGHNAVTDGRGGSGLITESWRKLWEDFED
ncbi:uncharacterized protein BJX67DRAFT_348450 [Aspergillus lucknowensis]|uniref:Uncharacterized protein n=1 Tax=Aspergillus lucknowensis TaxID=176173 RepID=A0ABR4LWS6_9EURO